MTIQPPRLTVSFLGWLGVASTTILVVASRGDLVVVVVATPLVAFFALAAILASPTHRSDLERRRTTIRAARVLAELLQECSLLDGPDAVVHRVERGLVDLLELRGCWFEPSLASGDLPQITPTGEVTAHVQRRLDAGCALPPLVVLPVQGRAGALGGFVLESDPSIGVSPERRLLAVAMAQSMAFAAGPGLQFSVPSGADSAPPGPENGATDTASPARRGAPGDG